MLDSLPILGICGWSGSGKTTLIESLIPQLSAKGLSVAVVKHDVHGIDLDRPGKDSDRFFRAGADVLLQGPKEELFRAHRAGGAGLERALRSLARRYDLVLAEGHKDTPLQKVWLSDASRSDPPQGCSGVIAAMPRDADRVGTLMSMLEDWLPRQWLKPPVFGCVLGCAEAAGTDARRQEAGDSRVRLERTAELLGQVTDRVVVVGGEAVTARRGGPLGLPGAPDAEGLTAGVLSAMRWAPHVSWLVATANSSHLTREALEWLLSTRAPGTWATIPNRPESFRAGSFLAHYDFRSQALLEALAAGGDSDPGATADSSKVSRPILPPHFCQATA